jgi:hypothetical protein
MELGRRLQQLETNATAADSCAHHADPAIQRVLGQMAQAQAAGGRSAAPVAAAVRLFTPGSSASRNVPTGTMALGEASGFRSRLKPEPLTRGWRH